MLIEELREQVVIRHAAADEFHARGNILLKAARQVIEGDDAGAALLDKRPRDMRPNEARRPRHQGGGKRLILLDAGLLRHRFARSGHGPLFSREIERCLDCSGAGFKTSHHNIRDMVVSCLLTLKKRLWDNTLP